MIDRSEGHPLGALLVIGAIFSVALAFSLATPPSPSLAAGVDMRWSPYQAAVVAERPDPGRAAAAPVSPSRSIQVVTVEAPPADTPATVAIAIPAREPAPAAVVAEPLAAFSWSTVPGRYPVTAARVGIDGPPSTTDRGAVPQAFATASSAIRSAFSKVF